MHTSWLTRLVGHAATSAGPPPAASEPATPGRSDASSGQLVALPLPAADDAAPPAQAAQPSQKRPNGRPRGTFGGGLARAAIRAAQQGQFAAPVQRTVVQTSTEQVAAVRNLRYLNVGSMLQKQLFLFASQQHKAHPVIPDNAASEILFQGRRPVVSLAAAGGALKEDYRMVSAETERVAAAAVESTGYLWGTLLAQVQDMLQNHKWQAILLGKSRKYDETPHRIRLLESTNASAMRSDALTQQASATGTAVKVLQCRFSLFMLLHHPETCQYLLLTGQVPCPLQAMDATTAENIMETQKRVESLAVGVEGIAPMFKMRVTLACTDRAGSNLAAEKALRQEAQLSGTGTVLAHTPCDIHKLGTCEKATLSLLESHISGLVNIGLSTRIARSTAILRQHLGDIFEERLHVYIGPPRCADQRAEIYDALLEDLSTVHAEQDRYGRAKRVLRKKQRLILDRYLNGDLESEEVQHWSPLPVSRDAVVSDFRRFVVPALVPGPCPLLNRSKFMGFESTAAWVALLATHHNLLKDLMQRFYGQTVAGAPPTAIVFGEISSQSGWFSLFQRREFQQGRGICLNL